MQYERPSSYIVNRIVAWAILLLCIGGSRPGAADVYPVPPGDVDLIGWVRTTLAREDESLLEIAIRHDLGREELFIANPGLPHWVSIAGSEVVLPKRFVLPATSRKGLVVNLPEKRLYWYSTTEDGSPFRIHTYPVSIGQQDWTTPLGVTRVRALRADPPWYPPESIRREATAEGKELPLVVPPGPANPLGAHALYLDLPGYLIHGTNNPRAIGMRVTHGCLRLYPEDVAELYARVPVNTPVAIVDQPVKSGWHAGVLYLEVHPPLEESDMSNDALLEIAAGQLRRAISGKPSTRLLSHVVRRAIERQDGIPIPVTSTTPVGLF